MSRLSYSYLRLSIAVAVVGFVAGAAGAQEQSAQNERQPQQQAQGQQAQKQTTSQSGTQSQNVIATETYRASVLEEFPVRNPEGEELGSISDVVMDLKNFKVRYVAVSIGGFLGIGDKLVAVPIEALKLVHDEQETYFVLDVSKQQLESTPGFNEENWPDVANPKWASQVDRSFGNIQTISATIEEVKDQQVKVRTESGESKTLRVGPKTQIVVNGNEAEASELSQGQTAQIQTVEEAGSRIVRSIEAESQQRQASKPDDSTK